MRKVEILVVLGASAFLAQPAFGWGERGHHVICEVATRLVKDPQLQRLLRSRGHVMGHVCNIPDIYWRNVAGNTKLNDSAHYMNSEAAGLTMDQVPLFFAEYLGKFSAPAGAAPLSNADKAIQAGSLWWRADQFYRRAVGALKSDAVDQGVHDFVVNLALAGHFAGDSSMPFHNTVNYDGWDNGHGGIHAFYESTCVDELPLGMEADVEQAARSAAVPPTGSVVERLKGVSVAARSQVPEIEKLDQVLEPSTLLPAKKKAVRAAPATACPAFSARIIGQLGMAAANLAAIWDAAYAEAGRPDLSRYHSYRYPLTPPPADPDYVP